MDRREIQGRIGAVLGGRSTDYRDDAVVLARALMRCMADEIIVTNHLSTAEARRVESNYDKNSLIAAIERIAASTPSEETIGAMNDPTALKNLVRPMLTLINEALVAAKAMK